mgnify:CR=1 FL=1
MKTIGTTEDRTSATEGGAGIEKRPAGWARVLRDVLVFQFKLVVDGLKDLGLAQVALGAAMIDLVRRDGTPGRRFYAVVRLSDRFDRWLDLHEPLARIPDDAPEYAPPARRSVDDLIDGVESSARVVAEASVSVSTRGLDLVRREARRRRASRMGMGGEALRA